MSKNSARVSLLVLMLLAVAMTTPAQTDSWSPFSPEPIVIDRVTLERNTADDTAHWEVWVRGHTDDTCDYPFHIDNGYHAGWLWVEIVRMIPTGAANCTQLTNSTTPFTEVIILSDAIGAALGQYLTHNAHSLAVEVNEFIGFTRPGTFTVIGTPTPPPGDSATPAIPDGPVLIPDSLSVVPTAREMVWVSGVEVDTSQTPIHLTITGHHPDGCNKPIRARYERDDYTISVEVYRVEPHNQGGLCPAVLLEYTLHLPLEEDLESGIYFYTVNEVEGAFDTEDPRHDEDDDRLRSFHHIESVNVLIMESFPPQINLAVTGTIPDGCDFETQVDTQDVGDTVMVHIFRELPRDIDCPTVITDYADTIPLGFFDPGEYTIDVNGILVQVEVE